MTEERQIYDDYETHLKNCETCAQQSALAEEGSTELCCSDGQRLVRRIQENFVKRFPFMREVTLGLDKEEDNG